MKKPLLLAALLVATGVVAQTSETSGRVQTDSLSQTRPISALRDPPPPSQIVGETTTLSGIAVQVAKADNPLQVLNPLAPEKYGTGERNVIHDPQTGRPSGLKLFSIEF